MEEVSTAVAYSTVAIIGRPNVGKSTLFNAFIGRRIAITERAAGTTRDRLLHPAKLLRDSGEEVSCDLVDTAGFVGESAFEDVTFADGIELQIEAAIAAADILIFLTDGSSGLAPADLAIARRIRKTGRPIVLAANKCDNEKREAAATEFCELGFGDPIPVSALHRRNLDTLRSRVANLLPEASEAPLLSGENILRVAIVGRRNAGKSLFVNTLCGSDRVVVSDSPGTTRDSVDVRIERDGKVFVVTDTAGARRRPKGGKRRPAAEFLSECRMERAIRRAEVVLLLIDALVEVGRIEKKLASIILEERKPCVLAVNKWDVVTGAVSDDYRRYLDDRLPALAMAPVACVSARRATGLWDAVGLAEELAEQARTRVSTSEANRILRDAIEGHNPPFKHRRRPKAYYAVQTGVSPPSFAVFVNDRSLFPPDYVRYLEASFRRGLGAEEIPVKLTLRNRQGRRGQDRDIEA